MSWLEQTADWELAETDFYEQYEMRLSQVHLPPCVSFLTEPEFLKSVRTALERAFKVSLSEGVEVTAHKLVQGQTIRLHNDFIPGGETHRALIQLNRGWEESDGGLFMLFRSDRPEDVHRVVPPAAGSFVAFAIGPTSYHAVSKVHAGERYTLVFSFLARP